MQMIKFVKKSLSCALAVALFASLGSAVPASIDGLNDPTADLVVPVNGTGYTWFVKNSVIRSLTIEMGGSDTFSIALQNIVCYSNPNPYEDSFSSVPCINLKFPSNAAQIQGGSIMLSNIFTNGTLANVIVDGTVVNTRISIANCFDLTTRASEPTVALTVGPQGSFTTNPGLPGGLSSFTASGMSVRPFDANHGSNFFTAAIATTSSVFDLTVEVSQVTALPALFTGQYSDIAVYGNFSNLVTGVTFIADRLTDVNVWVLDGLLENSVVRLTNLKSVNRATQIAVYPSFNSGSILIDGGNFSAGTTLVIGSPLKEGQSFFETDVNVTNCIAGLASANKGLGVYYYATLSRANMLFSDNTQMSLSGGFFNIYHLSSFTVQKSVVNSINLQSLTLGGSWGLDQASKLVIRENQIGDISIRAVDTSDGLLQIQYNTNGRAGSDYSSSVLTGITGNGVVSDLDNYAMRPSVTFEQFTGVYELWANNFSTFRTDEVVLQLKGIVIPTRMQFSWTAANIVLQANYSAMSRADLLKVVQFGCSTVFTAESSDDSDLKPVTPAPTPCSRLDTMVRCTEGFWFYNKQFENRNEYVMREYVESCTESQYDVPGTTTAVTTSGPTTTAAPEKTDAGMLTVGIIVAAATGGVLAVILGYVLISVLRARDADKSPSPDASLLGA